MKIPTRLAVLALCLGMALAVACGGGEKFPNTVVVRDGEIAPVIANSEIVVGENRLVFGVLDPEGLPIVDAQVHLVFYELPAGSPPVKRFEAEAVSQVPARDAGIAEQIVHIHADGTRHVHVNAGGEIGVYTAVVTFDKPGEWGVEMRVEASNPRVEKTLLPRFNVIPDSPVPTVGEPAPRSRNLTVNDVEDISVIDTSSNPSADMHTATIADSIEAGRPTLVLFAAPGFCTSRLCGPEMEIMRKLYEQYRDRVEFIHIEFFKDPGTPRQTPTEVAVEWNLRTEPWFFLIDGEGIIKARFEGPTGIAELDAALRQVAQGS